MTKESPEFADKILKLKKIIVVICIASLGTFASAQDPKLPSEDCLIVKKDNKLIKKVKLWNIVNGKLEYQVNGSLQNISIDDIKIIKTNDEIISFNDSNQLVIKPYDLIITYHDTIKCQIYKINLGDLYYTQREGNDRLGFIPRSEVKSYMHIDDSMVFDAFSDNYYEMVSEQQKEIGLAKASKATEGEASSLEEADSITAEPEKEEKIASYVQDEPLSGSSVELETDEKMHTFYEDENGNHDLIITVHGLAIICIIERIAMDQIYYHIRRNGPDTRRNILRTSVAKYFNNRPLGQENDDMIYVKSGDSFSCKIKEVKNGKIYFVVYKAGPDEYDVISLSNVDRYERLGIGEYPKAQLSLVSKSHISLGISAAHTANNVETTRVRSGMVLSQFFVGYGGCIFLGGVGVITVLAYKRDYEINSTNYAAFYTGSIIGAAAAVALVGSRSKYTKSNLAATFLGATVGALGTAVIINNLGEIGSFAGASVAAAIVAMSLPPIGAMAGHYLTRKPKESKIDLQVGFNSVGLRYNF